MGFSSGVFGVYTLPECALVHTLSISQHRIQSAAINASGEWLAFGSQSLGQLLVWEWQSETCAYTNDDAIVVQLLGFICRLVLPLHVQTYSSNRATFMISTLCASRRTARCWRLVVMTAK